MLKQVRASNVKSPQMQLAMLESSGGFATSDFPTTTAHFLENAHVPRELFRSSSGMRGSLPRSEGGTGPRANVSTVPLSFLFPQA